MSKGGVTMASTWIWRGGYDRLELVDASGRSHRSAGERAGKPLTAASWTEAQAGDAVIVWNDAKPIDAGRFDGVWLLNQTASSVSRMSVHEKRRVWQRAGLTASERNPLEHMRVYRARIFHLEAVSVERLIGSVKRPVGLSELEDPMMKRVVRAAVQGLYALGLDIGEAQVALGGDGRTSLIDAQPQMSDAQLEESAAQRFAASFAAARAQGEGRPPLLIGADPEFALVTPEGKVAAASRFFGADTGGAAGADAMLIGRRLHYPVAELRPEPAADPAALAASVRRLLFRAAERIGDRTLRWAAGAMPVPGLALGGHIHLSGAALTSRLLRLLDSYAAFPLALVEDPAGRGRRPRYGTLGDYRLQPHGGFEYRTLPSWLVSPAAAKAAFALALLCAREAASLTYIPSLEERYAEAYYAGDRTVLAGCLDGIAAALNAAPSWSELGRHIEPLLDAARRGVIWNESADIRVKWRIPIVNVMNI